MVPYFKGIHLTIVGWRQGRDDEGWKQLAPVDWKLHDMNEKAPEKVCAVPRLENDIAALLTLTEAKEPPERRCEVKRLYIFIMDLEMRLQSDSVLRFRR